MTKNNDAFRYIEILTIARLPVVRDRIPRGQVQAQQFGGPRPPPYIFSSRPDLRRRSSLHSSPASAG